MIVDTDVADEHSVWSSSIYSLGSESARTWRSVGRLLLETRSFPLDFPESLLSRGSDNSDKILLSVAVVDTSVDTAVETSVAASLDWGSNENTLLDFFPSPAGSKNGSGVVVNQASTLGTREGVSAASNTTGGGGTGSGE